MGSIISEFSNNVTGGCVALRIQQEVGPTSSSIFESIKATSHKRLPNSFLLRDNVVQISRELLGKCLVTNINGQYSAGLITETEAYAGVNDKASHAFGGRRTNRTEIMYHEAGKIYVYLCYGIHHLFNVVTNVKDVPHAVLIRAIHPIDGIATMLERRNKQKPDSKLSAGPGTLTKALGIETSHTGLKLNDGPIWLEDRGIQVSKSEIQIGPRVGIDYAEEDALRPYRFIWIMTAAQKTSGKF